MIKKILFILFWVAISLTTQAQSVEKLEAEIDSLQKIKKDLQIWNYVMQDVVDSLTIEVCHLGWTTQGLNPLYHVKLKLIDKKDKSKFIVLNLPMDYEFVKNVKEGQKLESGMITGEAWFNGEFDGWDIVVLGIELTANRKKESKIYSNKK